MTFLAQLWLPILLSAVFVFIVSSVIHMALPIHKGDCKKLKNEDAVLESLRANGVEPGAYVFPCAGSMKEMGSPEMIEKQKRGPVGWLTVAPSGGFHLGESLAWWFVFCLIVGVFAAYVGWHALGAGAAYRAVFRITGAAAVLGYAVGHFQDSVWKGVRWGTTVKFILDGVVYGLVTAGTFGWLWPAA
jgi:hypothetical protein